MERAALIGIREVFDVKDLELPILLGESENGDSIVFVRGAFGGSEQGRALHRSYLLSPVTT